MRKALLAFLFFICLSPSFGQDKNAVEFWNNSGEIFMDLGAHKMAHFFFQEGYKRDSSDSQVRLIAKNLLEWGKLKEACVEFEKLIERESINVNDLFVLTKLLYHGQEFEKSKAYFQKYLDMGGEIDEEKRIWQIHLNEINPLVPPTQGSEPKANRYCIKMYSSDPMNNNPSGVRSTWVSDEGIEYSGESFEICFKQPGVHKLTLNQFDDYTQRYYEAVEVHTFHFLEKNHFDVSPGILNRQMDFSISKYVPDDIGDVFVLWDFGDGKFGYGTDVSHVYSKSRSVTARVYVYSLIEGVPAFCSGIQRQFVVRK